MPHVLFVAPSLGSFHLHDRLAELAMRRGHRVSVLAEAPEEQAFWAAQGFTVRPLRRIARLADDPALPLRELAEIDCALAGRPTDHERAWLRALRRLRHLAPGVLQTLERDPPDAVLVHDGRSGLHRLVHFVARRAGVGVLHLGQGLLPATLACDGDGCDGDASLCRRSAGDYRSARGDRPFLQATLSSWFGSSLAPASLRRTPMAPSAASRLTAALRTAWCDGARAGASAWHAWRAALPLPSVPVRAPLPLPTLYLAVLLQPDNSARVRLDAPPGLDALTVLRAARDALSRCSPSAHVVGVAADVRQRRALAEHGFRIEPEEAAPTILAGALAALTINHPLAGGALLQGTPVVHLGRAPYGVPGVARLAKLEELNPALVDALEHDRPSLRERFLTRILKRDHVWCSAQRPDRNGLNGIMLRLEHLAGARGGNPIAYHPGPAWPLAAAR
ncbi:MAG: hypothetical protein R3F56_11590 [Planctomycetota bacterium]